jgi:hypothetical protein
MSKQRVATVKATGSKHVVLRLDLNAMVAVCWGAVVEFEHRAGKVVRTKHTQETVRLPLADVTISDLTLEDARAMLRASQRAGVKAPNLADALGKAEAGLLTSVSKALKA